MRDLHNSNHYIPVIVPPAAAITDNTAQVGAIIDRKGFDALEYIIMTGTLADADATFTTLLEEGDAADMSDHAAVDDQDLLGTEALASFTFAGDSKCFKLGYRGNKRYTRLTITPAANAGNAPIVALAHLGHPNIAPTSNPPA